MSNIEQNITEFEGLLLSFDRIKLEKFLKSIQTKYNSEEIINKLIVPTLVHIGSLWESGNLALSQIYMSSRLCEKLIRELFSIQNVDQKNKSIIGLAVLEDSHALGMQIVELVLKSTGYDYIFYDLGIKVNDLVEKIIEDKVQILLISTLMYRSALKVRDLVNIVRDKKLDTKIVVGGAPFLFDTELWKKVGADETSVNVFDVVEIVRKYQEVSN